MLKTRVTEMLGVDYPIIQGGMMQIAGAELVIMGQEAEVFARNGVPFDDWGGWDVWVANTNAVNNAVAGPVFVPGVVPDWCQPWAYGGPGPGAGPPWQAWCAPASAATTPSRRWTISWRSWHVSRAMSSRESMSAIRSQVPTDRGVLRSITSATLPSSPV